MKKKITDININGKKRFLSFLYKAGDKKRINWINKKGTENKNDANKEIFILETKTSGRAGKIILLFWESSKATISGFVNISLTKLTLKKKKKPSKEIAMTQCLSPHCNDKDEEESLLNDIKKKQDFIIILMYIIIALLVFLFILQNIIRFLIR